jgi:hypothetical protein
MHIGKYRSRWFLLSMLAAVVFMGIAVAGERQLDGMAIIGNQELPRALFIVPWKQAPLGEISLAPRSELINERLTPLDPDVFQRELAHMASMKYRLD